LDEEVESLLKEIHTAFQDAPRGSFSMHQAHIVKWADAKKLAEARALDHDQRWADISDETIEDARNALYGADPISWRYFVPAYLSWTLRNFKANNAFICDQTIYAFTPYEIGDPLRKESVLQFDTLSQQQRRCICRFLRYMACFPEQCDADAAWKSLEVYWGQFCPGLTS
jgi:hypothetical protein